MTDSNPELAAEAAQVAPQSQADRDRQLIVESRQKGKGPLFWAFTKLSGPGWLQSAITLGGGSLAGSLYLGVLAGYGLMWLQPLAMIMGVIMLSAIGYVVLSTGERPFAAINKHVSPVLGWGWAIATMMANLVWCMPQFALGTAAITQNLSGGEAGTIGEMSPELSKLYCSIGLFVVAGIVIWFYDTGGWGIRVFEWILKAMVGTVVICFFGVVIKMTLVGALDWGTILAGFIPDLRLTAEPSDMLKPIIAQTGDYAAYWTNLVVSDQQKVMITAAATAVGINMTFLLPYSMLAKGWDQEFRGLAIFDLSTGLFIPFMLATSCVVIASATQFHAQAEPGLVHLYTLSEEDEQPDGKLIGGYEKLLNGRLQDEHGAAFGEWSEDEQRQARADLPEADRQMAAMLVQRDAFHLADSLKAIAGEGISQYVFGIGVLGMAISTIIILMLINGFTFCEMMGRPAEGNLRRAGAFMPAVIGFMGPFFWSEAAVWLAVPTSMFGMVLLPIAYWTFFLMMNSPALMGENMPRGVRRLRWNVLMIIAGLLATFGSLYSIKSSPISTIGFSILGGFLVLVVVVHFLRRGEHKD
jgi:Mn2+/Fe2+ NRAMP family transporter